MFWVPKQPSHGDGSLEYPQHMFCLRIFYIFFSITQFFTGGLKSTQHADCKWLFFQVMLLHKEMITVQDLENLYSFNFQGTV